jgi:trans-aconitate methyltransferase
MSDAAHWDRRYGEGEENLSWHQESPTVSLGLLDRLEAGDASVLDVGGGVSALAEALLARGTDDVTVLDLSAAAVEALRTKVGADERLTLIAHDLLTWDPPRTYGVWHDRAVLHFLTDDADRDRYRAALDRATAPGSGVVLGVFAPDGPEQCSGLPVRRHDAEELAALLGPGFDLVETRREEHCTPSGAVQPFTWIAARRR